MKQYRLLITLALMSAASASFAGWNQQCLNDCFSTNHECQYCDYQCRVEDAPAKFDEHSNEYKCPF